MLHARTPAIGAPLQTKEIRRLFIICRV